MFKPLIISGPSGVGKTYLEKHLLENYPFQRIVSTTTRPPRPGEENGREYNFVSEKAYQQIENSGGFITSSNHLSAFYGFEKNQVEKIQQANRIPISVVVPTVVEAFQNAYPETIAVYLQPGSVDLQIQRMRKRGDSEEKIQKRLIEEKIQNDHFQKIRHLYREVYDASSPDFTSIVKEILKFYPTLSQ